MGFLVAVVAFVAMLYSLFTGRIPVRRRRSVSREERPLYYWLLILIQLAIAIIGVLDGLGIINIFN